MRTERSERTHREDFCEQIRIRAGKLQAGMVLPIRTGTTDALLLKQE